MLSFDIACAPLSQNQDSKSCSPSSLTPGKRFRMTGWNEELVCLRYCGTVVLNRSAELLAACMPTAKFDRSTTAIKVFLNRHEQRCWENGNLFYRLPRRRLSSNCTACCPPSH